MRNLKITKIVLSLMLMFGLTTASFAMGPGDAKKAPKDNGKVKVEQKFDKKDVNKDAKVVKKDQHKKDIAKKNDKNLKFSKGKHNKNGKHFAKKGHHKDYKFAKKHGHHKKHFAKKGHNKYFAKGHNKCRYYQYILADCVICRCEKFMKMSENH